MATPQGLQPNTIGDNSALRQVLGDLLEGVLEGILEDYLQGASRLGIQGVTFCLYNEAGGHCSEDQTLLVVKALSEKGFAVDLCETPAEGRPSVGEGNAPSLRITF